MKDNEKKRMNPKTFCTIGVAYGDPSPAGLPVSVGVPFPPAR